MGNPTPAHGLVSRAKDGSPVFLPLKSVSARVILADVSARVVLTQIYENKNPNIESAAQYIFPVPVNAAVCAFYMETSNGQSIKAVVKELSQAKKEFDTAVANDQWAGLLYQAAGDVFVLSVGAIPGLQDVRVTIFYVTELEEDEQLNQVRFQLPTYIAERYGASPQELNNPSSSTKSAKFSVDVDVTMTGTITGIRSPTHFVIPKITSNTATVTLDPKQPAALDKEFVLSVTADGLNRPRCTAEVDTTKNSVALSLTMVPQFRGLDDLQPQEIIFVIDRSGSMDTDSRIGFAKNALHQFVAGAPDKNTYFNIVSFGSSHSFLWNTSVKYDSTTRETAFKHIDTMTANYGGTELRNALSDVISKRQQNMPTSVIILTDGEIWDTDQTLATVRNAVANAGSYAQGRYLRFYTLGVGESASTALCKGLAEAGRGICYMTTKAEDITERCAHLLMAARKPPVASALGLSIDWAYTGNSSARAAANAAPAPAAAGVFSLFDETYDAKAEESSGAVFKLPPPPDVLQAPSDLSEFANLNRFIVSAIMSDTTKVPAQIRLGLKLPDGSTQYQPIPVTRIPNARPMLIHTLAARRIIRELEGGNIASLGPSVTDGGDSNRRAEIVKTAVIKFSEDYQVMSKFTAFLAVKKDSSDYTDDDYDLGAGPVSVSSEEQAFMNQRLQAQSVNLRSFSANTHSFFARSIVMAAAPPPQTASFSALSARSAVVGAHRVPSDDPVTPIARLQAFNGSFALDNSLVALLSKANSRITLQSLKGSIPASIRVLQHADPEVAWATLLVAAYLKVKLANEKDIWEGIWEKAMRFVMDAVNGGPFIFSQLLDEAIKVVQ